MCVHWCWDRHIARPAVDTGFDRSVSGHAGDEALPRKRRAGLLPDQGRYLRDLLHAYAKRAVSGDHFGGRIHCRARVSAGDVVGVAVPMDIQKHRFGSADIASAAEIARAGMFDQQCNSLLVGFHGQRPIWYSGMGGLLLVAGARSGKMRDILAYNICSGIYDRSLVVLDMKGEGGAISQDQTPDGKFCLYVNPLAQHGLAQHSLNPVDYIRIDSPTLVSDTKMYCENILPVSGAKNGRYFEQTGQRYIEAIILPLTETNGVLTLPDLYQAVTLLAQGGDAWLDFAFNMSESRFPIARSVEAEIAAARNSNGDAFNGVVGEITNAFACLSDPLLMKAVSPPFDFSMAQLCESDQAYQLYLMIPPEFVGPWAPVVKSIFVAGMVYKSRAPSAPQQTWVIDEAAQLQGFPLLTKLYSYGAGIGIRPWAVYQSAAQMRQTGPDAETIIPSSAALQSYFAVRDLPSARIVSDMLGDQTLDFFDEFKQADARHAQENAMRALLNDADPVQVGAEYAHHMRQAKQPAKMRRRLRTPDEILNMPGDKQFIFADGLDHPIYADRRPYFEQRFMTGRFHPNPFHPPLEKIRVKTRFGHAWRNVVREPVPKEFAHYPQYKDGSWSVVKG